MFRRAHGAGLDRERAAPRCGSRFLPPFARAASADAFRPVIRRGDVFHPVGMGGKLIAFLETRALRDRQGCKPRWLRRRFSASR